MTDHEAAVLIDRVSAEVADAFRPRLREVERESDRLLGEMRVLRRRLAAREGVEATLRAELATRERQAAALTAQHAEAAAQLQRWAEEAVALESRLGQMAAVLADSETRRLVLERVYTDEKRPPAHDHSTDAGAPPVVVFDLHETLTPSPGFVAIDQPGFLAPPFDGVKAALDVWRGQGLCLHIATAGLDPSHGPLVLAARQVLIQSWCTAYGLPIGFITGNVRARCYLDDRMVPVRRGDWDAVRAGVEAQLEQRTESDKAGIRRLVQLPDQGQLIEDWPDPDAVPPDQPRGLSTRILDVDVHRCLSDSNSSAREGRISPAAVDALRQVWDAGYQIHLSCAGWDPADKTPEESSRRLAAMRHQMREEGVRYDQFVSKDHGTAVVNDKGLTFTSWAKALPAALRMLRTPAAGDEVTLR